jgi:hypothetical protein
LCVVCCVLCVVCCVLCVVDIHTQHTHTHTHNTHIRTTHTHTYKHIPPRTHIPGPTPATMRTHPWFVSPMLEQPPQTPQRQANQQRPAGGTYFLSSVVDTNAVLLAWAAGHKQLAPAAAPIKADPVMPPPSVPASVSVLPPAVSVITPVANPGAVAPLAKDNTGISPMTDAIRDGIAALLADPNNSSRRLDTPTQQRLLHHTEPLARFKHQGSWIDMHNFSCVQTEGCHPCYVNLVVSSLAEPLTPGSYGSTRVRLRVLLMPIGSCTTSLPRRCP